MQVATALRGFLHWKARCHPSLFAFGIMRYVGVTHRRQFTGGVFTGVSMGVGTIGNDFSVFIGQQLRREFLDLFWWNVQRTGKVGLAVPLRGKCFDQFNASLTV